MTGEHDRDDVVKSILDPAYPFRPRQTSANSLQLTGYSSDEIQADLSLYISRVHPDDVPLLGRLYTDVGTNGHASGEYRFLHESGGYRWLRDELVLVRTDGGARTSSSPRPT
jgi:PAS domain-containing protein